MPTDTTKPTEITIKAQKKAEEVKSLLLTEMQACMDLINDGKLSEGIGYMESAMERLQKALKKAAKLFPKLQQAKLFEED